MKTDLQRSSERGQGNHGWLHSRFSFSFADYYNTNRMGFGKLRVLNDDRIAASHGFGLHGHENMEIITLVLSGELEHQDSTGVKEILRIGDVQVMSAGKGIMHSEFNHSATSELSLLQIWIEPNQKNVAPQHATTHFPLKRNVLVPVASGDKRLGSLLIQQDATVSLGKFHSGEKLDVSLAKHQGLYVFVIEGKVSVADTILEKRDALGVWETETVSLTFLADSFVLVFDVPV